MFWNIRNVRRPRPRREGGFSLIELMVVVGVMAVLITVSIPIFLGFRNRGADVKPKHALVAAAKIEGSLAQLNGEFTDDAGILALDGPSLDWSGVADDSIHIVVGEVNVGSGRNEQVLLYSRSNSGTWFGIRLVSVGGLAGRHTCEAPNAAGVDDFADCVGSVW